MKKILIFTLLLLIPNLAFAGDNAFQGVLDVIDAIVTLGAVLMTLAGMLIGWLLSPDWTNGTLFGMQDIMKELWILVSNVVYFVFAFLLVAIAFMNIIGKGGDSFALKTALPKFIVGVIMVPFTWFIVQFVVSVSSVLTASIMQLPASVFPSEYSQSFYTARTIPSHCTLDLTKLSITDSADSGFLVCDENNKLRLQDFSEGTPYGMLAVYSYDLLGFQNIDKIWKDQVEKGDLANNFSLLLFQVFKVLFFIVYVVLLIAMFFALFVRVVRLWLFMIFSPLFGLFFYFGKTSESLKNFDFKSFISLALVPVYVAGALSFGIFFLKVVQSKIEEPLVKGTVNVNFDKEKKETTIESGGTKLLTIRGNFFNWKDSPYFQGGIGNPLGPVGDLIVNCITLAIIWITVMAALNSSAITKEIIAPIATFGSNIGGLLKKIPQYTPIPGLGLDMKGLGEVSSYPEAGLKTLSHQRASRFNPVVDQMVGADFDNVTNNKILEKLGDGNLQSSDIKETLAEIAPFIQKYGMKDPRVEKLLNSLKETLSKDEGLTEALGKEYGIEGTANFKTKEDFSVLLAEGNVGLATKIRTGEYIEKDNDFTYGGVVKTGKHVEGVEVEKENSRTGSFNVKGGEQAVTITLNNTKTLSEISSKDVSSIEEQFLPKDLEEMKTKFKRLNLSEDSIKEAIKQIIVSSTKIEKSDLSGDKGDEILERIYNKIQGS